MKFNINCRICGLALILSQFLPSIVFAQSKDHNYTVNEVMLDPLGNRSIKSVKYYDGFGRPNEIVTQGVSGGSIYSLTEYDQNGRKSKVWLPVKMSIKNRQFDYVDQSSVSSDAINTYGDSYAYNEIEYDGLGRPIYTSTAGKAWNENHKGKSVKYITNTSSSVKKYTLTSAGNISSKFGYYPAGSLSCQSVTDEDGHCTETYKDILGNVVLERRKDSINGDNDTYRVYEKGLLRVVVPPLYQTKRLTSLLYKYSYDSHGRCIKKTLPGEVISKYWYDKYGRISIMQDAILRRKSKFRFLLYDELNRIAVIGTTSDSTGLSGESYSANVIYNRFSDNEIAGSGYCMTSSRTITSPTLEMVNYFDNYDFLDETGIKNSIDTNNFNTDVCVTTLNTGQMLSTSDGGMIYKIFGYDKKGRCIDVRTSSIDGYKLNISTSYSFTNNPIKSVTCLSKNGEVCYTVTDSVEYDQTCDLPLRKYMSIGKKGSNGIMTLMSENKYNDFGQLISVSSGDNKFMETYEYDLHGWLKQHICLNNKIYYGPIFSEKLYYADGPNRENLCYNGDISSLVYRSPDNFNQSKGFLYKYDCLNRLTSAEYKEGSSLDVTPVVSYSEEISYNANSAIASLKRYGKSLQGASVIDNLTYTYSGNRLTKVTDSGAPSYMMDNSTLNFTDGINSNSEYSYDSNGSMMSDMNKGVAKIEYDLVGMPKRIQFTNGNVSEYVYCVDGTKLKTIHRTATDGITIAQNCTRKLAESEIISVDSTMYIGAFEMRGGADNTRYSYDRGYVTMDRACHTNYHYTIRDYLGNVRAVISADGDSVEQVNNYYAYGAVMADVAAGTDAQAHKFGDKELDTMHGLNWYDFSARQYDSALGMFTTMDPLCELYYNISPYAYCMGNPINFVDPTGMRAYTSSNQEQIKTLMDHLKGGGSIYDFDFSDWNDKTDEFKGCMDFYRFCSSGGGGAIASASDNSMIYWGDQSNPQGKGWGANVLSYEAWYNFIDLMNSLNSVPNVRSNKSQGTSESSNIGDWALACDGLALGHLTIQPDFVYTVGNTTTLRSQVKSFGKIYVKGAKILGRCSAVFGVVASAYEVYESGLTTSNVLGAVSAFCGCVGAFTSVAPPVALAFDVAAIGFQVASMYYMSRGK